MKFPLIHRLGTLFLAVFAAAAHAEDKPPQPQPVTLRINGLFEPSREADLRAALEKLPAVALVSLDFEHGEGVFNYDPAVAFKDTKPENVVERFAEHLRNASHQTFSVAPRVTTPREKLSRVEVTVVPIDCKACGLALHEIVSKINGVAQALVSRKDGRIIALIDPEKTNRAALEEVLKKREVKLQTP